jgi:hypothetical protein
LILAVAAPFVAVAGGHATVTPRGRCSTAVQAVSPSLPTPVRITTACGTFEIARDGDVRRAPKPQSQVASEAHSIWASGVWTGSSHGHLLVGRGQRTLWRSHARFRREYEIDTLAVGRGSLAFSYGWHSPHLFVARFGGREHRVSGGEYPLGWTRDGFYTHPDHRAAILLRAPDGTLRATVAHQVLGSAYDQRTRSIWFVARGELFRADGRHVRPAVGLARLGLSAGRSLELTSLGRLLALQQRYRLVVLRSGSVFASTLLPRQPGGQPWLTGEPTAAWDGTRVAFAAMRSRTPNSSHFMQRGVETVYLLRPGAHAATAIHRERLRFNVCGHGVDLSWHGRWLLYSTGEGSTALIDTAGGSSIDLTSLARALSGFSGDDTGSFSVTWG